MKVVIARHYGNPKDYVFEVPDKIKAINPGDKLVVETAQGIDTVFAQSNIMGVTEEQLKSLVPVWGCKLPLAAVISKQKVNLAL